LNPKVGVPIPNASLPRERSVVRLAVLTEVDQLIEQEAALVEEQSRQLERIYFGEDRHQPLATLTGTRGINDATVINIIGCAQRHMAETSSNMPAFGEAYSDAEIASVAKYVTERFGSRESDLSAATVAKLRAAD
jgi:hypothetical protein